LYGFKTLSVILMEERILMQTEKGVLRKIFGSGRVEVTGHVTEVRSGLILLLGKLHLARTRYRWEDDTNVSEIFPWGEGIGFI